MGAHRRHLALVTSAFHMARSAAILRRWAAVVGHSLFGDATHFMLSCHEASDADIFPADVLAARMEREAASLVVHSSLTMCLAASWPQHSWELLPFNVNQPLELKQGTAANPGQVLKCRFGHPVLLNSAMGPPCDRKTQVRCCVRQAWHKNTDRFIELADMRQWMYDTHLCYAVSREVRPGPVLA